MYWLVLAAVVFFIVNTQTWRFWWYFKRKFSPEEARSLTKGRFEIFSDSISFSDVRLPEYQKLRPVTFYQPTSFPLVPDNVASKMFNLLMDSIKNLWVKEEGVVAANLMDIHGLACSKSALTNYETINDFAKNCCRTYPHRMPAQFLKSRRHVLERNETIKVFEFSDVGKRYFINNDGSHNFALLYEQAKSQRIPVEFEGVQLTKFMFNKWAFSVLEASWYMFLLKGRDAWQHAKFIQSIKDNFRGLPMAYMDIPEGKYDQGATIFFLAKNTKLSRKVASVIKASGIIEWGLLINQEFKNYKLD